MSFVYFNDFCVFLTGQGRRQGLAGAHLQNYNFSYISYTYIFFIHNLNKVHKIIQILHLKKGTHIVFISILIIYNHTFVFHQFFFLPPQVNALYWPHF